MSIALSEQMSLYVDVAITLKKGSGTVPPAVLDRSMIDLLLAIDSSESITEACEMVCCSTRHAQRMMKRFTEGSGLTLVKHHGFKGTSLSDEARQCIDLYVALRQCTEQLLKKHPLPRPLPPLSGYPTEHDWNHGGQYSQYITNFK